MIIWLTAQLKWLLILIFGAAGVVYAVVDKPPCVGMSLDSLGYKTGRIEVMKKTFNTGSHNAEITIPDSATRIVIALSRNNWKEDGEGVDVVQVKTDYFDGKNWILGHDLGGFTTDGGVRHDDCGNAATDSFNDSPIPEGTLRQIRIKVMAKDEFNSTLSVYFK